MNRQTPPKAYSRSDLPRSSLLIVFLLLCSAVLCIAADPTVQFSQDTIVVSQTAGVVQLPFTLSEVPSSFHTVDFTRQNGTARGGRDFEALDLRNRFYTFRQADSASQLFTVPIYFTGSKTERIFTVVMSAGQRITLGTPASIKVIVKAFIPQATIDRQIDRLLVLVGSAEKIKNVERREQIIDGLTERIVYLQTYYK